MQMHTLPSEYKWVHISNALFDTFHFPMFASLTQLMKYYVVQSEIGGGSKL